MAKFNEKLNTWKNDPKLDSARGHLERKVKGWLFALFRTIIVVGIAYVILSPLIGIVANSFFSTEDRYSPVVYIIPQHPTLERYELTILRMDYWNVLKNMMMYVIGITFIQLVICSMAGYGFARFNFPMKRILFACVIITIVLPAHAIMYPLYTTFQSFDPLWIFSIFTGGSTNLLGSPWPVVIMTLFGVGLRSGLYIFIFTQFFRGLPREIEEAAIIDGAGNVRTFTQIMLPNASPAIITVAIFSIVWQYNDNFLGRLFNVSDNILLSRRIASLQATIANLDQIRDPSITTLYVYAAVVLMILPLLLIYVLLQKYLIEGIERSGIVG
ncbi:MAG: carbohydrate ABC transporter permease [Oscillospiraceae bacterium]|jgi:multiple sugar transport system permease protein|nr:carbohydrate ABC transporter permease [Oscillospiraceae bacterium]